MRRRRRSSHHRVIRLSDEDPLSTMANLFDTGMVFAVALMTALVSLFGLRVAQGRIQPKGSPATKERLERERVPLKRFRESHAELSGEGERLGTAYRLSSGEVVYVPDE